MAEGKQHYGERPDAEDCALCGLFNTGKEKEFEKTCDGCPVAERTGQIWCNGSPYADAHEAWEINQQMSAPGEEDKKIWEAAAQKEIDFLESLLPKKRKPRKK